MLRKAITVLGVLLIAATVVWAQGTARVVTSCGTLPQTYAPGSTQPPTVDINGNSCFTGGAGGTAQNVNIQQVAGSTLTQTVPTASIATSSIIGAVSQARVMSAASTNATSVAATPGNLYAPRLCNTTAAAKYFKLFDLTVAPTVGTSTPIVTWLVPAGQCLPQLEGPISFVNGIAYSITGGVADADTTVVALNDVVGVLLYKAQ